MAINLDKQRKLIDEYYNKYEDTILLGMMAFFPIFFIIFTLLFLILFRWQ